MKITYWNNLHDPNGHTQGTGWSGLASRLMVRTEYLGDAKHPGWSPAEFRDNRRAKDGVLRVWALCLDYDSGESIEAATGRFEGLRAIVHTSRKHTSEHPRFRLVLDLSRPVSPFEFAALWKRVAPVAGDIDQAPKDPSRFWFLPGCAPDAEFLACELQGKALDVDEWLAKPEPVKRDEQPMVRGTGREHAAPLSAEERASAYIAKMPEAISGSQGHMALWNVALVLVKGFSLTDQQAMGLLRSEYNPRCQPAWTEKELWHKVANASAAKVPDGFKLNNDREWQPKQAQAWSHPPPDPDADYEPEPPEWLNIDNANDARHREPGDDTEDERARAKTAVERYEVAILRDACLEVWETAKRNEKTVGYTTGIEELDGLIGGLRPGHVTLLAASTSWGKSSFGVMVADENIRRSVPTLVVSVEDPKLMYARRIVARRGGINALNLRDNDLSAPDIDRIAQIAGRAEPVPFFMSAMGMPVEDVAKAIRALVHECGIKIVIADYVGRFRSRKTLDRRNHVTHVAETLTDAIKASGSTGILLAQLKRIEGREPTMDDVKESGDLENGAEHVLLGHKYSIGTDSATHEQAFKRLVLVPKNKDGPVVTTGIELNFNEVSASFTATNKTYSASDPDPPKDYGTPEGWADEA